MDWNEEFFVGRDEQMGKNGRDNCFIEFRTDAVRFTCQTASLEDILFGVTGYQLLFQRHSLVCPNNSENNTSLQMRTIIHKKNTPIQLRRSLLPGSDS